MISRQSRPSEKVLERIFCDIRNIDKLLWIGDRRSIQDLDEHIYCVKRDLDEMMEKFKQETEEQWLREKAEIEDRNIVAAGSPPVKKDCSESQAPTFTSMFGGSILGEKDFPCGDKKCKCNEGWEDV